jgi:tetratricopeptide (TPR) repeat protein
VPEQKAGAYGRAGRLYLAYRFRSAAAACFRNAAALAPGDRRWHYYRGVAVRAEGRLEEAAAAFERALALSADDPATLLHLASVELDRRRMSRGRELFEQALEAAPAAAHYGLGRIDSLEGRHEAAIAHFEAALAAQPHASAVRHALGLAQRDTGDLAAARRALAAGGSRPPSFADPLLAELDGLVLGARAQLSRGSEALRHGDLAAAEAHFRRAAERAPGDAVARYNLGTALGEAGRHEEARAMLAEAARLDPEMADAWLNLASALARLGRLEEAAAALDRVLELAPDDAEARRRRELVERHLGRRPPAAEVPR